MPRYSPLSLKEFLNTSLNKLQASHRYRNIEVLEEEQIKLHQSELNCISFSSNDYLNFSTSGTGSTGSRLTTGTHSIHKQVEKQISDWKKTEDTILFSSGYLANIGTIAALANIKDIIFVDELAHSCMWDGIRLSGAKKIIFKHNDLDDLTDKIKIHRHKYEKAFILTESVFSMDGDTSPLEEMSNLSHTNKCILYVDEAHSLGVFGDHGQGLLYSLKATQSIHPECELIEMGTLSKGLGVEGGYVTGSKLLIDFLKNRARSFVYSTAMSIGTVEKISYNLNMINKNIDEIKKLQENITFFRELLKKSSFKNSYINNFSAIFALLFDDDEKAISYCTKLKEEGFFTTVIRKPTVKTTRIRICLNSNHTKASLDKLIFFLDNFKS